MIDESIEIAPQVMDALRRFWDHVGFERELAYNTTGVYERALTRYLGVLADLRFLRPNEITQKEVSALLIEYGTRLKRTPETIANNILITRT